MPNTTQNQKFEQAICFATERHGGQVRKGSDTPYIVHPLEVMMILQKMNADTDLLIAGLFHDLIEDTDTTVEEIREKFGDDVAALVAGHSEDKSRTWQERKQTEIDETMAADHRMKKLVLADKLANMRSIKKDYDAIGGKLWERFKAGREKQAWYYGQMVKALGELKDIPEAAESYGELRELHKRIFC